MYRIGEFARLVQMSIKTLRHYDKVGLLRPARIDRSTGYRQYAPAQIEELNRILVFKDLGFSLREIQLLVAENVPVEQMRTMLREKNLELEETVRRDRARLARAEARLRALELSGEPTAHDVAMRIVPRRLVASVRDFLASHGEEARLFDELARGYVAPSWGRGAIFHACARGMVDCEALVFVPSPATGRGRVRVRELPAERVASLVYRDNTEYMVAYRAMRAWLAASGARAAGPKREIYLDRSRTEIQLPIQGGDT